MEIIKEFYGLNKSVSRLHEILLDTIRKLGYFLIKEEDDIWMKDEGKNYSYLWTI